MFKRIISLMPALVTMVVPAIASAHVIVTPSQVGIGQELTFNISVPNEQQTPVVSLVLDIPSGVSDVVPTVKDGWTITPTMNNSTSDPEISVLTWTNGSIPVGQREDFSFSAQVPGTATNLDWKAYQTYGDGTIVHWDQTPNGKSDDSVGNAGPYSVTKVVNDLAASSTSNSSSSSDTLVLIVSLIAILLSIIAFLKK
jgi:uncharacterized protein YcnI